MYADKDPEDAYDAGDPPNVNLDVLERVVADLRAGGDRREARRVDVLRVVANLGTVPGVDLLRLAIIRDDLNEL